MHSLSKQSLLRHFVVLFLIPYTYAQSAMYNVTEFGARGDGVLDNTDAIQKAIDTCSENGGGIVLVPTGLYTSKSLYLKENVNLHLLAGATIKGSSVLEDYPFEENSPSGESDRAGLITARDVNNVSITGQGTIDGNGLAFVYKEKLHWGVNPDIDNQMTRQKGDYMNPDKVVHGPMAHGERPGNLVRFLNCDRVTVQGVRLKESPTWTMSIRHCHDVHIEGLTITSFESDIQIPNDDGINLNGCKMVRISDCYIHTGDDPIAVHGCVNLTVTNCTMSSRSCGIRVGGSFGDTKNCIFSNLVFFDTNRALGIFVRSEGSVRNILFSDIIIKTTLYTGHWWGQGEPIHVSALPSSYYDNRQAKARYLGTIEDITFRNISAVAESGILLYGCDQSVLSNLTFENVKIKMLRGEYTDAVGGNFDLRHTTGFKQALFEHDIPAVYANTVKNLKIRNLEVQWGNDCPEFFTNALYCENISNLQIDGLTGRQCHPDSMDAAVVLKDVNEVSILNSKAAIGCGIFLDHSGVSDFRLFGQNDLLNAKTAMSPVESGFVKYGNILKN